MLTAIRKLPRGVRKHIRREKNRIRKNISESDNYREKIKTLYKKWQEDRLSKNN